ncbi:MAG: CDP-glycerol glycerophosphotransferase family protein, partial [Eggerthellaceae bacterium]|nr:CDP-glycerol glycerophosphotransferase family protein [Eggerthellaceae bacterium]
YPIERSFVLLLGGGISGRSEFLFNYEKEYDVYLSYYVYSWEELSELTHEKRHELAQQKAKENEYVLYVIELRDSFVVICKHYVQKQSFSMPDRFDYYSREITPQSLILFFDRYDKADDNAEHLYRYIMQSHPEFTNIWFAVAEESEDFKRLKDEGFRIIPARTNAFRDIYLRAEMIVSSQIYLLRPLGKSYRECRFVYLQHGIITNNLRGWIERKRFDKFITTSLYEKHLLETIAPKETLHCGIPRLQVLAEKRKEYRSNESRVISFLPSWRFSLSQASEERFLASAYAKRIQAIFDDEVLQGYLRKNDMKCLIKWHPNMHSFKHLFCYDNELFQESPHGYMDVLAQSKFVFTDYSSVVLDAAFVDIPICYYQWDRESFYASQPFEMGLDLEKEGAGPVFHEHGELIDYIVQEKFMHDRDMWLKRKKELFGSLDVHGICECIVDEMLKC